MSQASDTRKLYRFEREYIDPMCKMLEGQWSIEKLRVLANNIWFKEAPLIWTDNPPKIIAGRGIKLGGKYVSYCLGRSEIVMARDQRIPSILIHEIAHALRNGDVHHNKAFTRKYFYLLEKYLDYHLGDLYYGAMSVGIKI